MSEKYFNQIRVGDTFFLTEENIPDRFMKIDPQTALSEKGKRIPLGKHVLVSPEFVKPYSQKELDIQNMIDGHTGGDVYYRSSRMFNWFYHTQGIHDLVEQAACYWLVDAIVSWQVTPAVQSQSFQSWTLEKTIPLISPIDMKLHVEKGWMPSAMWVLRCTDGGATDEREVELCRQYIPYSSFPLDSLSVWVEDGTAPDGNLCKVLLLPSEH